VLFILLPVLYISFAFVSVGIYSALHAVHSTVALSMPAYRLYSIIYNRYVYLQYSIDYRIYVRTGHYPLPFRCDILRFSLRLMMTRRAFDAVLTLPLFLPVHSGADSPVTCCYRACICLLC
jgi:hypothetical protein